FTSALTLKTAGNQTVSATDTVTSSITGSTNPVSVNAASASSLSVVPSTGSTTAGTAINLTVRALDQFNNTVVSYTGTVHFTSTDAQATVPADYSFSASDNGTHTFTGGITLKTAGSQSVTATDVTTGSITGSTGSVTVGAATGSRLSLVASTGSTTAGDQFSVTLTALDAFNNVATGYRGMV